MKRSYNFRSKQKTNRDNKIITFCVIAIVVIVSITYMYCNSLDVNKTDHTQDMTESANDALIAETEVSDEELDSSIGSMAMAGNRVADMQNQMIKQNDEYLLTIKNAVASGYYDPILMTDEYKQLLAHFNKQYMKENPKNSSGILWSEYGVWEFNANYDYSAEANPSMKAVWVCYDKNDTEKLHPYAVCTATYVTATDSFIEPVLSKTEWYPRNSYVSDEARMNGMPNDVTVSADQCGDESAANGSNDDGEMTEEQKKIKEQLQLLLDSNSSKQNAVTISH